MPVTCAPGVPRSVRVSLSALQFLQNFLLGSWWVTLATFLADDLGASPERIALAVMSGAVGAIVSPFVVGLVADRYLAGERVLRILHIVVAILLVVAGRQQSFAALLVCVVVIQIAFMPTQSLATAMALRHLPDPSRQFPPIRAFGTVGWIVAGLVIAGFGWEQSGRLRLTFAVAAGAAMALVVLTFLLPHTPPASGPARGVRQILGFDAIGPLLRRRSYVVFFVASMLAGVPLAFYYTFTNLFLNEIGVRRAAGVQTLGQMAEVGVLLVLPWTLRRTGIKGTIALGLAAWAVRYLLFAAGNAGSLYALLIAGLLLHGVCFNFFFVAGQMYTDEVAPLGMRSAAQGLTSLASQGVGSLVGTLIAGWVVERFATPSGHDWGRVWPLAALATSVILAGFLVFFREERVGPDKGTSPEPWSGGRPSPQGEPV